MSSAVIPVTRGCGKRKAGGIYWETGLSPYGVPLETFLFCPPVAIPSGLKINPRGVTPIEQNGVVHLIDWVGETYYPNVLDFLNEVRRFGLSRRIPSSAPFHRLTKASRLLIVHPRAIITNFAELLPVPDLICPKENPQHAIQDDLTSMCGGLWFWDVQEAVVVDEASGQVRRDLPAFSYGGHYAAPHIPRDYQSALIASMPCSNFAVVEGNNHEETMAVLSVQLADRIPLEVVYE